MDGLADDGKGIRRVNRAVPFSQRKAAVIAVDIIRVNENAAAGVAGMALRHGDPEQRNGRERHLETQRAETKHRDIPEQR